MRRSTRRRVLLALVPPLLVVAIQGAAWELIRPFAWFLFIPAVLWSAWIGRVVGGTIATVLSAVLAWWFFVPPEESFAKEPRFAISTAVFIATGIMISALVERSSRANERLRRVSDERRIFAALVDNSFDFIGIADPTGTPRYVNPAGRRMVALPPETRLEATRIADYLTSDRREFAEEVLVKATAKGGHWLGETYFRNWQTNAAIPVSDSTFAIRDPDSESLLGIGTVTRDISDLRRAREEVEAAHERLRSLFDGAPEGIFIADRDGRYTEVNDAGCCIVGYSREELVGKSIVDLIRPEDVARLEQARVQMVAGNEIVGEWWLHRKDGTYVPVEVVGKILSDGRWQGFVRDITARKQLESALAAKSKDFERAQSVAQTGSWRIDPASNEIRWSDELYRIYGIQVGTPASYAAFLDRVPPEDRAWVDRRLTDAVRGTPYDFQHRLIVDGQIKWVRNKAELEFDDRGSFIGGLGIVQDITERKRLEAEVSHAQERIELALKGADLAAWDWNIETGEMMLTARWDEMRGYPASDHPSRRQSWSTGIHPDDLPRVRRAIDDHLAGRTPEYECEFRVATRSGSWIWVLDRGKVFARNAQGQPLRMLGTVLDITTRKQSELERARLYRVAQQAIQARDDVLGIIAHDLRNPLNAINLQAEMLREAEGRDRNAGEMIQRSVMRMNRLIQDILDVTRLDAGQLTVDRRRLSAVQAILDVVEAQRPLAEKRGLALVVEIERDLPDVWADRDRLLQICENLIGNALKFTEHGSVTVGAAMHEAEVLLWVKDTGSGIPADALPHLFDRFWQLGKDAHQGAGLGLAIVKGLVDAHGGRIWVESTLGIGSSFYFTIPTASVEATESVPAVH